MENEEEKIKYKIVYWKDEYARKQGENYDYKEGIEDLEEAKKEAHEIFEEWCYSCVEVIQICEEDEDCVYHISTQKPKGEVVD